LIVEHAAILVFEILFGLVIGSFLTVCIYRIPFGREKGPGDFGQPEPDEQEPSAGAESSGDVKAPAEHQAPDQPQPGADDQFPKKLGIAVPPRSFCPHCRGQLLWRHNIPVLSWLFLRGRCALCGKPISVQYPLVEVLTALSALLSFQMYDLATAIVVFVFCCALIVLSFIDYEYYILPNVITLPGMAAGVVLAAANQYLHWFQEPVVQGLMPAFWGLLAGGGFLFAISETYYLLRKKMGLGFGDVKLMAVVGLMFGPQAALYTIFFGSFAGSILGALLLLLMGHKLGKPLPFGPYLALGAYLYFFAGPRLPQMLVEGVARLFM
jgi:leader peptidase (prepilin peptidase) / N-methyltransferase